MKAKIINSSLDDYGSEYRVRRMNFSQVIVNCKNKTGIKNFSFNDVKCIVENEIDDFLINNRQVLKIKLKRGISVNFYSVLLDVVKNEIESEVKNLSIIKDKYKVNKRGIWEKEILMLINNKFPVEIIASGENFKKNSYNIIINKIEKENFLESCREEILIIKNEIDQKNLILNDLEEALQEARNANIS